MIDALYGPFDGSLWHVDLVFVKRHGRFRTRSAYGDDQEMARLAKGTL